MKFECTEIELSASQANALVMASAELMDPVKGVLIVCRDPNTGGRQTLSLSIALAIVLITNTIATTTRRLIKGREEENFM